VTLCSVELVSGSVTIVFGETLPGSICGGVTGVVAPVLPRGDTELGVTGCCEVALLVLLLELDCKPDDKLALFIILLALYCAIPGNNISLSYCSESFSSICTKLC